MHQPKNQCECEHEKHFDQAAPLDVHCYSAVFGEGGLRALRTPYGTFHVCGQCADTCYHQYRGE